MARVLVVDDEPDVLLLCRLNLEQHGHEVFEAGNGEEALLVVRERRPDLIVLDLMLPGVDGYGVLEALRSEGSTPGSRSCASMSSTSAAMRGPGPPRRWPRRLCRSRSRRAGR